MTTRSWKFALQVVDEQAVEMPADAQILHVGLQSGAPCMWVPLDADAPRIPRTIRIHGTGNPMPDYPGRYLGTFMLHGAPWCSTPTRLDDPEKSMLSFRRIRPRFRGALRLIVVGTVGCAVETGLDAWSGGPPRFRHLSVMFLVIALLGVGSAIRELFRRPR